MTPSELKDLYQQRTGEQWDSDAGISWLMKNYEYLDIYKKTEIFEKSAHITLSDKANWLSQPRCSICKPDFPIINLPIRIQPESWQAIDSIDKNAFKNAIASRLATNIVSVPKSSRVCLSFLFVCSEQRRIRDLDNMAKLFMDSIKGIIMGDDKDVDHLNLMRMTHTEKEEYVMIKISASNLNNHSDTVLEILNHSWAGQDELHIEDFRS
ncbi:RusA family crossover junction endodeoxyribonuclease [Pseudoalteromonas xiamenensis]|uniref:RusA family crossover junction endodeoxyribonuclease n=1 Tax=Pseudoalteromonas xiamenensis TaxID=882626 RepID=UPI0035E8F834